MSRARLLRNRALALLAAAVTAGTLVSVAGPAAAAPAPAPSASATPFPSAKPVTAAKPSSSASPTPTMKTPSPSPRPSGAASTPRPSGTPAPSAPAVAAPVGRTLLLQHLDAPVLTLPAGDHVRDTVRVQVRSGAAGTVDLVARLGSLTVPLASKAPLQQSGIGWQRTVRVPVGDLTPGTWRLAVRRSAAHGVRASTTVRVGSGRPVRVTVTPSHRTLRPYRDGVLDALDATVAAADETGVTLPITGTLRLDAGRQHRVHALTAGSGRIAVTGLPLGDATLTATVRAPSGTAVRTVPLVLAPTGVGALRLTPSADTVQPVSDGLLDAVTLTTSGSAAADSPAPVSGSLTVAGLTGVVRRWTVASGSPTTFSWDGRIGGAIVPGVYTVTLTLHGPQGQPQSRAMNITVSKDHLPYRVRDLFGVADGDQQGLAVHDGMFYVATDVGAGSARIDVYDAKGVRTRSIGPLPIGHGAALSFSTTTGLLYAANGGANFPTSVWAIDPAATDAATAVQQTIDLSALGPNGMVGVDDAGGRLLVFSGVKNAYTLSAVGFDGTVQRTVPMLITGTPQGMEVVGTELWLYTSMKGRNRLARYSVTDDAVITASTGTAAFDLMNPGEGEGFAFSGVDGAMYVGAHGPNRIGVLEPVADE